MSEMRENVNPPKPPSSVDFYELSETLPVDELATLNQVREFMQSKVAPVKNTS